MNVTHENSLIQPLISLTSPLETNVKTLFFPPMGEVAKKRSAGSLEERLQHVQGDAKISNAEVTDSKRRVKPNNQPIDPGHFYMDQFVSNKQIEIIITIATSLHASFPSDISRRMFWNTFRRFQGTCLGVERK